MKYNRIVILSVITTFFVLLSQTLYSQLPEGFTVVNSVKTVTVKNQQRAGTCWAYATTSFFETEALRKGKPEFDLSEMFFVRYAYMQKAKDYVNFHGVANFSQGGQAHDALNVLKKYGAVTEEAYSGLTAGYTIHNHTEMVNMMETVLKQTVSDEVSSPRWQEVINSILDVYLGKLPEKFIYNSKEFTPKQFATNEVAINPNDYIELTSYNHHDFYTSFDLEIPDNWSHDHYYNIPLEELMQVIDYALSNGFSVCWDGDVSEDGFLYKDGLALIAETVNEEPQVTQLLRQETFENWTTTDDHLMHLTGSVKDANGNIYYSTKNSWSATSNNFGGYLYKSSKFVQLKTVAIMVHKDAIPKTILNKLKID